MKLLVAIILLAPIFFGSKAGAQAIVIAPSTSPVVFQGTTLQFSATGGAGTWSCSGCAGSIDSATGLYTAPATVHAQQSFGGYQLLPNNHVFNTRIDSLPVNSSSTYLINGAGTVPLSYESGFPENFVGPNTPLVSQIFNYSPGNNGVFQIPTYPLATQENGWFTPFSDGDHHLIAIDTTTGMFQEIYQPVNRYQGSLSGCPSCTADSGVRYQNNTYNLPNTQGGSTDAAGLYLVPLTIHPQELEYALQKSTTINHALRFTLQNGYICGSSVAGVCAQNATGMRHLWPATADTTAGGGVVPYGARFRLKAAFNISTFSPIAKILLTQLKQYGIILADGGTGWAVSGIASGKMPPSFNDAAFEIGLANIAPSNFEAVDESSLMISSTSGDTTQNRETVTFTRTSDAARATVDVALVGVSVGLPTDTLYIQAGVAAQQFKAYVNGGANDTVTWAMTPATGVGSITSGGLYTPPATSASIQIATVTATSTDNTNVSAQMTLAIYPNGAMRIIPTVTNNGNTFPSPPFTDTSGNVWSYGMGGDGTYGYPSSGPFPTLPNYTIYKNDIIGGLPADLRFDIVVPTGTYQITGKFIAGGSAVGQETFSIETNGVISKSNLDVFAVAGATNTPVDEVSTYTVTNGSLSYGTLSYVLRPGPSTGAEFNGKVHISALQIIPILTPVITSAPTALSAVVISSTQVNLSWAASTDNVGVTGYNVFRGGVQVATPKVTSFSDTGLTPSTSYSYTISAFDAAGNVSALSAPVSIVTSSAPFPTASLVAAYSFNEGSGKTAADVSGSSNTGVLNGAAAWTAVGKFGAAIAFTGTTGYVEALDINALTPGTSATFEAWVLLSSTPTEIVSVFNKWSETVDDEYLLGINTNKTLFFAWQTTGGAWGTTSYNAVNGTGLIPTGVWTHIAAVRSGATISFYINGVLDVSLNAMDGNPFRHGINTLRIGGQGRGANRFLNGSIDELRVYNQSLTPAQIQSDMKTPIAGAAVAGTPPPSVPPGVTGVAVSSTQLNVSWTSTGNLGVTGYNVFRGGVQVATTTVMSFSDTGLTPSTSYTYTVSAFDAAGDVTALSAPLTIFTASAPFPTASLVAAYSFNEGSGKTAADVSGSSNTGVLNGTAAWTAAGKFGAAMAFTGTTGYVEAPDINALTPGTSATFEAWVILNSTPTEIVSVFNKWSQTGDDEYLLGINTNKTLFFAWQTTAGATWGGTSYNAVNGTGLIPTGVWTHIAAVRSGATINLYINGVLDVSLNAMDGNPFRHGINTLRIGGQGRGANRFFNGTIDELRVYNQSLTPAQIQLDMKTPIAGSAVLDTTPPSVPAGVNAVAVSSTQLNVSWTASTDNVGVAGYKVFRGGVQIATPTITSFSDTGLTPSTSYSYTISAFDAAGNVSALSAPASIVTSSAPFTAASLVAAYSFNEGSGKTAADVSGSSNSGVLNGAAAWTAVGKFGAALAFSGTTGYVEAPDINALTPGISATFEAWVILNSTPTEIVSVFNKWSQTGDDEYLLGINTNKTLFFAWQTTGGAAWGGTSYNAVNGTGLIPTGVWTHIAAVRSGAVINLYINGVLDVSLNAMDGNPFRHGINTLRIGGQGRGANRFLNGSIDELRVYNQSLTPTQIQSDMKTPIAGAAISDTTPPSVPAGVNTVAVSSIQINVSWTASTDNVGVAGYKVFRGGVQVATPTVTSFSDTGLTPSTSYSYTVSAFDAAGNVSALSSPASAVTSAAPVSVAAAYSFNEGSGKTTADASGNKNAGTLNGVAAWTAAGKFGAAIAFTGTTGYVEAPDINALTPGTSATFEAWVLLNSTPTEIVSVFNKWSQTVDDEYLLGINTNKTLFFAWQTTGGATWGGTSYNAVNGTGLIPTGVWTHIAAVRSGATINLYINGVLDVSLNAMDGNPFRHGINTLRIGGQGRGANRFLNGSIDELRVYNQSLTPAQIQSDMKTPIAGSAIADTIPPTVAITAPANGATVSSMTAISGTAADNTAVSKVQVSVDTGPFQNAAGTGAWSFVLNTGSLSNGVHTITAKATDAAGNVSSAVSIPVTVSNIVLDTTLPTVSIVTPANGATVSGTVTINVTASDNVGVTKVDFYLNSTLLGTDTAAPYSSNWSSIQTPNGTYTFAAKAYDAAGNVGTASITITINNSHRGR